MKRFPQLLVAIVGATFAVLAQAAPVFTGLFGNTAIRGYDPVAYFTDGKPVKGSKDFTTEWMGATWQFASKAHLDQFKAEPAKFAPQYGGYCAYAVAAKNELVATDPEAWAIVDGRLFLNYDSDIQKKWAASRADYIRQGDVNWVGLSKK
ncbi:MAG TPA: YHS domain-containing (seleno)protein [Nevskiaceae bacterium]|nr:YHS domain-containing (seleno)protein [Nevskiaceae bacterium]